MNFYSAPASSVRVGYNSLPNKGSSYFILRTMYGRRTSCPKMIEVFDVFLHKITKALDDARF
jgi:murein endopeptidase